MTKRRSEAGNASRVRAVCRAGARSAQEDTCCANKTMPEQKSRARDRLDLNGLCSRRTGLHFPPCFQCGKPTRSVRAARLVTMSITSSVCRANSWWRGDAGSHSPLFYRGNSMEKTCDMCGSGPSGTVRGATAHLGEVCTATIACFISNACYIS